MEVRLGAEVGMKNAHIYDIPKTKPPVENPANLPGDDMNNRQIRDVNKASHATNPVDLKARYQALGNSINIQA